MNWDSTTLLALARNTSSNGSLSRHSFSVLSSLDENPLNIRIPYQPPSSDPDVQIRTTAGSPTGLLHRSNTQILKSIESGRIPTQIADRIEAVRRINSIGLGFVPTLALACVQPIHSKQSSESEQDSSADMTLDGTDGDGDASDTESATDNLSTDSSSASESADSSSPSEPTDSSSASESTDSSGSSETMEEESEDDEGLPSSSETDPEYDELYEPSQMPTFNIKIEKESWDALVEAGQGSKIYQRATLRYNSETYENIGIRLKGRGSFENLDGKPSFKIRLDKFVDDQLLLGLRSLTLNNMVQDPSFAHERLAYFILRQFGLAAPLCNSAKVYVNDEYYGLYANLQTLDKVFVADNFSKTVGNLYDITNDVYFTDLDRSIERQQAGPEQESRFELETNKSFPNTGDLTAAIDANYNNDQLEGWWGENLSSILDVDQFLRVAVAQAIIVDWDGYFGARNNYKLYHNPLNDRFVVFSWGLDQTFGMRGPNYYHLHSCYDRRHSQRVNSLFLERCKIEPQCWDRYLEELQRSLDLWDALDLLGQIDTIEAQIEDAVEQDIRSPYSFDQFRTALGNLRDFATRRGQIVRQQLESGCTDRSLKTHEVYLAREPQSSTFLLPHTESYR